MQFVRRHKLIVSLTLAFVFMAPMSIKLLDSTFHHHDDFVCHAKKIPHFHKPHKVCPVPGFTLSVYDYKPESPLHIGETYFRPFFVDFGGNDYKKRIYYFSLRAPPVVFLV